MFVKFVAGTALTVVLSTSIAYAAEDSTLHAPGRASAAAPVPAFKKPAKKSADEDGPYVKIFQGPIFGISQSSGTGDANVDESALRYYASQHNAARVESEIRRLKALHPNWVVPVNIYSTGSSGNDEQPLWDLFAAGKIDGVRSAITQRMRIEPEWRPSHDLISKIDRKEAIDKLIAASNAHKWANVLEVAAGEPSVMSCGFVDANWRVAEAFYETGAKARALEIYRAILASCSNHEERVASARKTVPLFTTEEVKALIGAGGDKPDGASEFDAVKLDLTRARLAAAAAGKGKDDVETESMNDFVADAEKTGSKPDVALLGWYHFGRGDWEKADHWFTRGLGEPPVVSSDPQNVKFAEGKALALVKLTRNEDARRFAWEWRDRSKAIRSIYVGETAARLNETDPARALDPASVEDFAGFVQTEHSFDGAQALAWRYVRDGSNAKAAEWFKTALSWKGLDLRAPGPADETALKTIEGYISALRRLERLEEAVEIADAWRNAGAGLRPRFIEAMVALLGKADAKTPVSTQRIEHLSEIVIADRSSIGAQTLGWLRYRSTAYADSAEWFARAISWSPEAAGDDKIAEGYVLALKEAGRLTQAEDVAWPRRDRSPRLRAVYLATVIAQISGDDAGAKMSRDRIERFAAVVRAERSPEAALALGFRRLKGETCGYGETWFRSAIDWSKDKKADAKAYEGLALSLKARGETAAAEDLAYVQRDRSPEMRAAYFAVAIDRLATQWSRQATTTAGVERLAATTIAERNSRAAQALGWRRLREAGSGYGVEWFRRAAAWRNDGLRDAKLDEGMALALARVGRLGEAEAALSTWAEKNPALRALAIDLTISDVARDAPPEPIDETRLKTFAAQIEASRSPDGASALGWYRLQRAEYSEAEKWFNSAAAWWPPVDKQIAPTTAVAATDAVAFTAEPVALRREDYRRSPHAFSARATAPEGLRDALAASSEGLAKSEEGRALALRALGRIGEAEAIAYTWRDFGPTFRVIYHEIAMSELARRDGLALEAERVERYAVVFGREHSVDGARAMGWRLYEREDFARSVQWFRDALDWSTEADAKATPNPSVLEGYALALRGAKRYGEALAVAAKWADASPHMRQVYFETAIADSQNEADGKASGDKFARIEDEIARVRSFDGARALGWVAYQKEDFPRALVWFRNAVTWAGDAKPDAKAIEGLALTLRRMEEFDEFAAFAHKWRKASKDVDVAYYGGMIDLLTRTNPGRNLSNEILADFEKATIDDRSVDGAQALGWHLIGRGDFARARTEFKNSLDWAELNPMQPASRARHEGLAGKIIEGYARALRGVGGDVEAEEIAFAWVDVAKPMRELYLQIVGDELGRPDPAPKLSMDRVVRFAKLANLDKSAPAAQSLGWHAYSSGQFPAAVDWFEKAQSWLGAGRGDDKLYLGYALALKNVGRLRDAEDVAWRRRSAPEMRAVYISIVVDELSKPEQRSKYDPKRLNRFAEVARAEHDVAGALAIGWARLDQPHCDYAVGWFQDAIAWSGDKSVDPKTYEGLALALRATDRGETAENLAYSSRDASPSMRKLYLDVATEAVSRDWPRRAVSEARLARFGQAILEDHVSLAAQALAWHRYRQAGAGFGLQWFRLARLWANEGKDDAKLNEGLALALRTIGANAEAEEVTYPFSASNPAMKKLYIDIVVEQLSRDLPPEPMPDLRIARFIAMTASIKSALGAQSLGWYRYSRGENEEAAKWFKTALDWWPQDRRNWDKRLSAPVDDYASISAKLALVHADYRRTPRAYPNSSRLIDKTQENYVETARGLETTLEGHALALRALGRIGEAEEIAFAKREKSALLGDIYLDIAIGELTGPNAATFSKERAERLAGFVSQAHSLVGAQALAWRAYAANEFDASADWFKHGLDWATTADAKAVPDERLIEGYVLALRGAKRFGEALAVATKWEELSTHLRQIKFETAILEIENEVDPRAAADKLVKIEASITQARSRDAARALGWLAYQNKDLPHALIWFKNSVEWTATGTPDPKAIEGLALTLRQIGQFDDFALFAHRWRHTSKEIELVYYGGMIDLLTRSEPVPKLPADMLADFEAASIEDRSVVGAQALGWHLFGRGDFARARAAFKNALEWTQIDPMRLTARAQREPLATKIIEGYVQSLRRGGSSLEAEEIAYAWSESAQSIRELYLQIFADQIGQGDLPQVSPERLTRYAKLAEADKSSASGQSLGWLAYRMSDFTVAVSWFEKAQEWLGSGRGDAKLYEGYVLSLKGAGRLTDAEHAAWRRRTMSAEIRAAYVSIVVEELSRAELRGKFDPNRIDRFAEMVRAEHDPAGAQAIGWLRLEQEHCGFAVEWFRNAIAWTGEKRLDPKLMEGLVIALRTADRLDEAEDLAFRWRDRLPALRDLYLATATDAVARDWPQHEIVESRLVRFGQSILANKNGVAAQALAWRRYRQAGRGFGLQWFKLARAWSSDGKSNAKLNEGLALTLRTIGANAEAEELVYPFAMTNTAMKKLYIDIVVEQLARDLPPEPMSEPRIARFVGTMAPIQSALGAQALGWYRYERGENEEAVKMFRSALDWWPTDKKTWDEHLAAPVDEYQAILAKLALMHPDYRRTPRAYPNSSLLIGKDLENYVHSTRGLETTLKGYALSLLAAGHGAEAEDVAYTWQEKSAVLRAVYLEIATSEFAGPNASTITQGRIDRFAEIATSLRSVRSAQALGWRAYGAGDNELAAIWFGNSLDWADADKNARIEPNLVEAYALALRGSKRYAEGLTLVDRYRDRFPTLRPLYVQLALAEVASLDPNSAATRDRLVAVAEVVSRSKSPEGAMDFGWLAYQRKDFAAAEAWFRRSIEWAHAGHADEKALEGFALTLQALGKNDDLMTFASQWGQKMPSMKKVFLSAMVNALASASASGDEVPADLLTRASALFGEARNPQGAQALAWERIASKDWKTAEAWFRAALEWRSGEPDAKATEGLIIALRNMKRFDEAETIAFKAANRDAKQWELYIEILADRLTRKPPAPPSAEAMKRFADVVLAQKSANGAQAIGWYSYNAKQSFAAVAWFEKAMEWQPTETTALGLAFAYRNSGDKEKFAHIVATYRDQYQRVAALVDPRIAKLLENRAAAEVGVEPKGEGGSQRRRSGRGSTVRPQKATDRSASGSSGLGADLKAKNYSACASRAQGRDLSAADNQAYGWCLLNLSRPTEAADAFDRSYSGSSGKSRDDAAYGRALALIQSGQTGAAAAAAGQGNLTPDRRNSIGVEVLSHEVYDSYNAGRYVETLDVLDRRARFAPETRDLMGTRGWTLRKLGREEEANQIFHALDAQLSTPDSAVGIKMRFTGGTSR